MTIHPALAELAVPAPVNLDSPSAVQDIRTHFMERLPQPCVFPDVIVENSVLTLSRGECSIRSYHYNKAEDVPTLVFFHGGGFVLGNLDALHNLCCEIAIHSGCHLISVDYPKAPENPFPAAPEVCYEATCWIWNNLESFGGNRSHFSVGGSSAGATLAAVVALMARDKKGPSIHSQILLCPMVNTDLSTSSYVEHGCDTNLTTELCRWFLSVYPQKSEGFRDPYFMPMHAESLRDLPQALIITAGFDPLCDDGYLYAQRLNEDGGSATHRCYKDMIHGFYAHDLRELEGVKKEVFRAIGEKMKGEAS